MDGSPKEQKKKKKEKPGSFLSHLRRAGALETEESREKKTVQLLTACGAYWAAVLQHCFVFLCKSLAKHIFVIVQSFKCDFNGKRDMDTSLMVFIILTIVFISLSLNRACMTNKGESKSQIRFKSFFVVRQICYKQFRTAWIFFLLLRHLAVMMGVFFQQNIL